MAKNVAMMAMIGATAAAAGIHDGAFAERLAKVTGAAVSICRAKGRRWPTNSSRPDAPVEVRCMSSLAIADKTAERA
jgi:hypothetical protein